MAIWPRAGDVGRLEPWATPVRLADVPAARAAMAVSYSLDGLELLLLRVLLLCCWLLTERADKGHSAHTWTKSLMSAGALQPADQKRSVTVARTGLMPD